MTYCDSRGAPSGGGEGDYFDIDGSVMEGGGQILRMSAGLASLFSRPIRIHRIRAGRAKPGLKGQHLSGLHLMKELTGGQLEGAALGSSEIRFRPGQLRSGHYTADTKTAGAVCLLAQISVPAVIFSPGPVSLSLEGGTNTDMAPQIDEYTEILLPNINRFGVNFEYEVVKKGFFPSGGGKVNLFVNPVKKLLPISLTDPRKILSITGWSFSAGNLPLRVAEQMTAAARKHLLNSGCDDIKGVEVEIQTYKEDSACSPRNGSGIVLVARTSTGCVLGGSAVGSSKVSSEQTGRAAADSLLESVECGGCVDKFIQDQMIIFMALAEGESRLVTGPLTLHTETAIHIASVMTGATFRVESCQNNRAWLVICQGVGYKNKFL